MMIWIFEKIVFTFLEKMSGKMIEMSGCGKIDIEIARMFWKSFTLQPPIESKLYSPDIKQRRKTADAGGEFYSPRQHKGRPGRIWTKVNRRRYVTF